MGWWSISSPPVPQPAPAPAPTLSHDSVSDEPPSDLPSLWYRPKDMFGTGAGEYLRKEFPDPMTRLRWVDLWYADFEIVHGEDITPKSDT